MKLSKKSNRYIKNMRFSLYTIYNKFYKCFIINTIFKNRFFILRCQFHNVMNDKMIYRVPVDPTILLLLLLTFNGKNASNLERAIMSSNENCSLLKVSISMCLLYVGRKYRYRKGLE